MRVASALMWYEFIERARDRWVVVITALFAALAGGIALYGGAADDAGLVTAPSLVTLATFLVPLVALILGHDAIVGERERNTLGLLLSLPVSRLEVLVAKYAGRGLALGLAIGVGMGSGALFSAPGRAGVLLALVPPTLVLGAAFLSIGVLISVVVHRTSTAASLAVVTWFSLVFFYDLGLLAAMVATDGALSQETVAWLVNLNPAGLYRMGQMAELSGPSALSDLGLVVSLPGPFTRGALWVGWIVGPLAVGATLLTRRRAVLS